MPFSNAHMPFDTAQMMGAKAWPFELARQIVKRLDIEKKRGIDRGDRPVIFETGYGPSGLPHIGTFGEVARTTMVRKAFIALTDGKIKTQMIAFSDDMDGFRKVPVNMPNQDMLAEYLGKPLSDVPDPFGCHDSYAAHNNNMLREFLDSFGFDYDFKSASEEYRSGRFDDVLLLAAQKYQDIMNVMLPTLGAERQATYSPFLPISPSTGRVLYVPMKDVNAKTGEVTFEDEDGSDVTMAVTGGNVKMQWKPDFGMRWAALGVDFEMFGKDHQANAGVYSKISKILGAIPPVQYVYELFLDEKGEKISKSKGNGIAVEDWLKYAMPESLSLYNYTKPRTAKRLSFDVIPKATDEYFQHLAAYAGQEADKKIGNPVWYIHDQKPPTDIPPVSFSLLLNLVSAANASDKDILWGFISNYAPDATPQSSPALDKLTEYAVRYYQDFVKPHKSYRAPSDQERAAMEDLKTRLTALGSDERDSGIIQTEVFSAGKSAEFENLRDWFKALYEVLLGQSQGPRFGSFVAIYGVDETLALIEKGLSGQLLG
ncbi:MAG: lysine--tRNA ligase [Robiginitomaculum sp.]